MGQWQGWGGRPVRAEQAQGILVAALGCWRGSTVIRRIAGDDTANRLRHHNPFTLWTILAEC
jgi:hypothetical protein